jgi:hypothetical protein
LNAEAMEKWKPDEIRNSNIEKRNNIQGSKSEWSKQKMQGRTAVRPIRGTKG